MKRYGAPRRLPPFSLALAWMLLYYGAAQQRTCLRFQIDFVGGPGPFAAEFASALQRIGTLLLRTDIRIGQETLLDHLRKAAHIALQLAEPSWFTFERASGGEAGMLYQIGFDLPKEEHALQESLTQVLTLLLEQSLSYSKQAASAALEVVDHLLDGSSCLKPVYSSTLFGAVPTPVYLVMLENCLC